MDNAGNRGELIRPAAASDLPALGRLGAMLLRLHHEFDHDRFMGPDAGAEEGYAAFLATQLAEPDSLVLVADRGDGAIGYVYASVEPRSWKELRERAGFIHDVLVDERHRRSGLADALLDAAVAWLCQRRVPRVLLWTAAGNEQAQRLFLRTGFRRTMIEMTLELGQGTDGRRPHANGGLS